ncbi:protein GRIP isoform X1 [Dioscorea cayenensis subsp. rotundata]|uniref:Protein GRIP isoform X1 n=2 Tax=Dioscorea cayennensis subsp. rotundata TaxID=55577 RepID=A0AB40C3R9_DIOCR|nr:protein GRIP isoform X1 [Dioscorea cayenensis subsp. rotundata]
MSNGMAEVVMEGAAKNKLIGTVGYAGNENGVHHWNVITDETDEDLTRMVIELSFQNDYLKAQIGSFNLPVLGSIDAVAKEGGDSEQLNQLHEKIKCLNKEIQEQKETQKAAEDALEHLRAQCADADSKVQGLSEKLAQAQQKMEQEIKERDDKYVELDSKFSRLHKRAKQRIQELQKEKDDLETRVQEMNVLVEQASNQQTLRQQDIEKTRQQANEALRLMDSERQQLRAANKKLRENVDEMHIILDAKESALAAVQQTLLDKEKELGSRKMIGGAREMLEDTHNLLRTLEEKRQSSFAELSAKHQKQLDSLSAQLAEAAVDRKKAAETISSLQLLIDEKDKKIANLDAVTSGEVARLGATLEEMKGELAQLQDTHEKERESWEAACQALRTKLEASESACLCSEIEAAKMRSQLEQELSMQHQLLNARDAELTAVKDEIKHIENEFSAYKVRAHALLQKKDAEITAARNSADIIAQQEAVREAERELALALAERDKAMQDLLDAFTKHEEEITARDAALNDVQKQMRDMAKKLDTSSARFLSEKELWQKNLESIEESWKFKYAALEAQNIKCSIDDIEKAFEELKQQYRKLKEEHDTFRDVADRALEEKEAEVVKLLEDNKYLRRFLESKPFVDHIDNQNPVSERQDSHVASVAAAEQQILLLARQQAQREEELAQSQRHILALQEEIEELEQENRLHSQQEAMLKSELRNMERSQKREGVDMTYLKNVILKLLETGEVEALLPVVGTLLQFSPEEIKKCQQAYHSSNDVSSQAFAETTSTPQSSLFSRFSFS